MNNILWLSLAAANGVALGAIFYGRLWWTISKGLSSEYPVLWFLSSLILRLSLIILGFYLIFRGHWDRILACLVGFVIARIIVTLLNKAHTQQEIQR